MEIIISRKLIISPETSATSSKISERERTTSRRGNNNYFEDFGCDTVDITVNVLEESRKDHHGEVSPFPKWESRKY